MNALDALAAKSPRSTALAWLLVLGGLTLVGLIDLATGIDVHVFSLYFVPLALAGSRLGLRGAVLAALAATAVWVGVQLGSDLRYASAHVWPVDIVTQGAGFLAVGLLCTRLAEAVRAERMRSRTDPITGLLNQAAFIEHAQAALALCRRHRRPVALARVSVVLPQGSAVDTATTNALMHRCGRYLGWSMRASDVLGRADGDGFAVLMPEADDQRAAVLVERLRTALEGPEAMQRASMAVAIGVVTDPVSQSDVKDLLKLANDRLLEARHQGQNQVCVAVAADAEAVWTRQEPDPDVNADS